MFGLAHRAGLLAPAETAFDHRPARLRHTVAFMPRGASVDGALTTLTASGDALFCVTCGVTLMARRWATQPCHRPYFAHCDAIWLLASALTCLKAAPGSADGKGAIRAIATRSGSPWWHRPCNRTLLPARRPCGETAVGIAGACMRVIFALLAVEVGPAVIIAAAVLGAETLVRGPRLDQRSVHRKCSSTTAA